MIILGWAEAHGTHRCPSRGSAASAMLSLPLPAAERTADSCRVRARAGRWQRAPSGEHTAIAAHGHRSAATAPPAAHSFPAASPWRRPRRWAAQGAAGRPGVPAGSRPGGIALLPPAACGTHPGAVVAHHHLPPQRVHPSSSAAAAADRPCTRPPHRHRTTPPPGRAPALPPALSRAHAGSRQRPAASQSERRGRPLRPAHRRCHGGGAVCSERAGTPRPVTPPGGRGWLRLESASGGHGIRPPAPLERAVRHCVQGRRFRGPLPSAPH